MVSLTMEPPCAIDLFSGCGGLTLGLREAGFKVVGAVEIDPLASTTYVVNHPGVLVWTADIRQLPADTTRNALGLRRGGLDLLAGCPPCQGFSSLRRLNGGRRVRDPESKDLLFEYLRFAEEFFPKAVMLENVPQLANDYRMTKFVSALRRMGFHCRIAIFNCADFGVPQRRKRMVLLGSRLGPIAFPQPSSARKTVRETIYGLPRSGTSGDPLHDVRERRSADVADRIRNIPKDGGSRTDLPRRFQLGCHLRGDGFKDIYGRMAWDEIAPTITTGCFNPSKGRFLHPVENRAITLREAALLQSFPPDYFFSLARGKAAVATLIGNALPPMFVRHQAITIRRALESKSTT
jgi:DNA (cytosine-5)-methyltransferase 1